MSVVCLYPLIRLTDSIGGLTVSLPAEGRKVTIGEVDQERQGRVSSGNLVSDLLKSKIKFTIKFEELDGSIVKTLVELRKTNNDITMLFQETYTGALDLYTVRIVAPFDRTRLSAIGEGIYEDITIEIEEV
jgi:hypothetical protein